MWGSPDDLLDCAAPSATRQRYAMPMLPRITALLATVLIVCAFALQAKRRGSGWRGRRRSHEDLYLNVNAGRGGDKAPAPTWTVSHEKPPAAQKRNSNLGATTSPSSPKKRGCTTASLDDSFFGGASDHSTSSSPRFSVCSSAEALGQKSPHHGEII